MATAPTSSRPETLERPIRALRWRRRNTSGAGMSAGIDAADGADRTACVRRPATNVVRATEMLATRTTTRRTTATSSIMSALRVLTGPEAYASGPDQERLGEGGA